MTESPRDMLSRLKLIASGERDCDLSDNDELALRWIISRYEYFVERMRETATPLTSEACSAQSDVAQNPPRHSVSDSMRPLSTDPDWPEFRREMKDGLTLAVSASLVVMYVLPDVWIETRDKRVVCEFPSAFPGDEARDFDERKALAYRIREMLVGSHGNPSVSEASGSAQSEAQK